MKPKKYAIERTQYFGSIFMALALILIGIAEMFVILSSRASTVYQLTNLLTIEILTEVAIGALILVVCLSFILKGRIYTIIFDIVRIGAVVVICYCLYSILAQRAELMGYVWFSDLEKNNENAVNALNFGVYSAVFYLLGLVFLGITSGLEYVTSIPLKRTKIEINQEIEELKQELEAIEKDPL